MRNLETTALKEIFPYSNFTGARGGTELMMEKLVETVDNSLLKKINFICSYIPKDFKKDERKVVYWVHDRHDDPAFKQLNIIKDEIDYFVFVSYWQKEMFRLNFNLPYEKCVVIKNALTSPIPVEISEKYSNVEKIHIAYTSTPQRGLTILYEVFNELSKEYPDYLRLHVYSSFDIYGHYQRNVPFENLYEKCKAHQDIEYYGSVEHDILMNAITKTHIWTLPSIWPETSCIAAMEAMSAGNVLVHSNLAALPETTANFAVQYPYVPSLNQHASVFYEHLKATIETIKKSPDSILNHIVLQKIYADTFYNWNARSKEWTQFLSNI